MIDLSAAYRVRRVARHETIQIRGLDIHLTWWGPRAGALEAPVFLLHGWQDTGSTFQFLVDAFLDDWPLVALDWRGYGRSEAPQQGYWFADYFADLDALLDRLSPGMPARVVGHSMGGNIVSQYAGLRPERIRCIVNLEGFGLPRSSPEQSPVQMRKWLDQVRSDPAHKEYDSLAQLTAIIRYRYPRFTAAQAGFVAAAWSEPRAGRVRLLGDPRHRWINPVRYHREDAEACWRAVTAPMLMLLGDESEYLPKLQADGTEAALRSNIPHLEIARIAGAGHMLHIEQPAAVAALVEDFLRAH